MDDDHNNPIHYTRDPHKLIAYLIPFPKPKGHDTNIPDRFLIYTPPPPPFPKPAEGEKESRSVKVQRKWQEEVRAAKTSEAKAASWAGLRKNATKAEMVLVYPASIPMNPEQIRTEFINTMLRSQSKAQRDSILATGLLPVTLAIDILSTPIWPFGGLFEVDAVWAYASIRGARIARSTTKRLTSTGTNSDPNKDTLHIRFQSAARLDILRRYLAMICHERNPKRFPSAGVNVTETEVLEAIGWSPSQVKEGERNWEDEQWELTSVKDDLRAVMGKGAREWNKWVGRWEEDPKKAAKK
ncbi:hypothetical protein EJ05DRAFT_441935 [Pseudovirgaria hyperparasitica]|uniref:Secreted protein n=1 Tax=Pseudovirgaria hyperparasitica TaxID=470096 RepID=A0A6A6W2U9_9PEZI|nr:uncharacterized protein EJ05DRAFT_441935 [Pseudovirgaria hyperparasitica]KAF2755917.1 hypothetical protein EJ05DRAFT_441935 [Pseudovirgaria hyperparasitica]